MTKNHILHVDMGAHGKGVDPAGSRNIIIIISRAPRQLFILFWGKKRTIQGHIWSLAGFKRCCPQAGVCFTQAAGISIFECGLFGIVCFSQTDTTALPHSLELSQCLQTPQQTLPHHPAVARQHRRSRFQREQSHERLHGESISMGECQK